MLKNHVEKCIDECYEEILHTKVKSIKPIVQKLKEEFPEGYFEDGFRSAIADIISILVSQDIDDQEEELGVIDYVLSSVLDQVKGMKTAYQFKVEVEGYEKEVYRIIDVPSLYSLSDFAYMMLSSFNCDASHLFQFNIKGMHFICDSYDDYDEYEGENTYAKNITIKDMDFKKNAKFTLIYDFGESYKFKITCIQKKEEEFFLNLGYDLIVDGKGYGIWEDASYEMDLFYHDKEAFVTFLKENAIDEDRYPMEEVFDIDVNNEQLRDNFMDIKLTYEADEELNELLS